MKRLSWIITLPLMAVAVVFAIANREAVVLDLWPLALTIKAPLFLLVLGSIVFGLLAGAAVAWVSAGATRRRAREARRRVADLERELAGLREAAEKGRPVPPPHPAAGSPSSLPVAPPPQAAAGGDPRSMS